MACVKDAMELSRGRLAWSLFAVTMVLIVGATVLSVGQEEAFDTLLYGLLTFALAGAGALVASKHPGNPIGWLFLGQAVFGGLVELAEGWSYLAIDHDLPGVAWSEWFVEWSWIPGIAAWVITFLLFPTGRLLSRRWSPWVWLTIGGCVVAVVGQALTTERESGYTGGSNPVGVDATWVDLFLSIGLTLVTVPLLAGLVSLIVRFRRAGTTERQQLKWFAYAAAAMVAVAPLAVAFWYESVLVQAATALAFTGLPVTAGIAILRYRLYDIDVVINRTLVYGGLTATLGLVYLGSVLLLQLVLSGITEGSGLAVAASTLAVAALVRPGRARFQTVVDRRFYRSKYDAQRTLEAFSARLRDQVELDALGAELRAVVIETMHPAHVSLWLKGTR